MHSRWVGLYLNTLYIVHMTTTFIILPTGDQNLKITNLLECDVKLPGSESYKRVRNLHSCPKNLIPDSH